MKSKLTGTDFPILKCQKGYDVIPHNYVFAKHLFFLFNLNYGKEGLTT